MLIKNIYFLLLPIAVAVLICAVMLSGGIDNIQQVMGMFGYYGQYPGMPGMPPPPTTYCGDGNCDSNEYPYTCPEDCGTPPIPPGPVFHKVCNAFSCVNAEGPGNDSCNNNSDCEMGMHRVCMVASSQPSGCLSVIGPGEDQCSSDFDCYHYECIYGDCSIVMGKGTDTCLTDSACMMGTSCVKEGKNARCVPSYSKDRQCESDSDCPSSPAKTCKVCANNCRTTQHCHNYIVYKICHWEKVCGNLCVDNEINPDEECTDQCQSDAECFHKECIVDGQCVEMPGPSPDGTGCESDSDCGHKECVFGNCMIVGGPGEDSCKYDSECGHKECIDGLCIQIEGEGADACTSYSCQIQQLP